VRKENEGLIPHPDFIQIKIHIVRSLTGGVMKRIYWNDISSRFTGISFPIGGFSWNPPPDERKIAEELVTYLENQGLFYAPFEWEHPKDCYNSADRVRDEITATMQKLRRRMAAFHRSEAIRVALREFQRTLREGELHELESKSSMNNDQIAAFDSALIRLRRSAGAQIASLVGIYGLSVYWELDHWLYPPVDDGAA